MLRSVVPMLLMLTACGGPSSSAGSPDGGPTGGDPVTRGDSAVGDTAGGDSAAAVTISTDFSVPASDGVLIAATSYRTKATADGAPGVLLIHEYNQNRAQWSSLIRDLMQRRFIVIAIDLRGHGDSGAQTGPLSTILNDPNQAPLDVQAGIEWLLGPGRADPARLAVIGTSVGANLACVASANGYGVKLAVAVSARDTAVANLAGKALGDLTFSGLYIMASEDDGAGAQASTANAFFDQSSEPRLKLVRPGFGHGKDLILEDTVWPGILGFIDGNL